MARRADLVEAEAFERRRRAAALLGGLDDEEHRPGRAVLGGAVLAAVLVGGAAVAGHALGRPDPGWLDAGSLVVSRDTGQQYVVLDEGRPRPVPNHVSARLLLGEAEPEVHTVGDDDLAAVAVGEPLGIVQAPATVPPGSDLTSSWTACSADSAGVAVTVGADPADDPGPDPDAAPAEPAVLVTDDDGLWLVAPTTGPDGVARARRHRLAGTAAQVGTFVTALGFPAADHALRVDPAWLALVPEGTPLDPEALGVARPGVPASYVGGAGHRVGDLLRTPDGDHVLVGDRAPQRLDPFAALVYGTFASPPRPVRRDLLAAYEAPSDPADWPDATPPAATSGEACVVLGSQGDVALATPSAAGVDPHGVPAGEADVAVDPTGGAWVRRPPPAGTSYVVDNRGLLHRVAPGSVAALGYEDVAPAVVPDAWLALLDRGVTLSEEAALRGGEQRPEGR